VFKNTAPRSSVLAAGMAVSVSSNWSFAPLSSPCLTTARETLPETLEQAGVEVRAETFREYSRPEGFEEPCTIVVSAEPGYCVTSVAIVCGSRLVEVSAGRHGEYEGSYKATKADYVISDEFPLFETGLIQLKIPCNIVSLTFKRNYYEDILRVYSIACSLAEKSVDNSSCASKFSKDSLDSILTNRNINLSKEAQCFKDVLSSYNSSKNPPSFKDLALMPGVMGMFSGRSENIPDAALSSFLGKMALGGPNEGKPYLTGLVGTKQHESGAQKSDEVSEKVLDSVSRLNTVNNQNEYYSGNTCESEIKPSSGITLSVLESLLDSKFNKFEERIEAMLENKLSRLSDRIDLLENSICNLTKNNTGS